MSKTTGSLGDLHSARVLVGKAAAAVAQAEVKCVRASAEAHLALEQREGDGDRLYVLLGLFDRRRGTDMDDIVRAAREGWERSHPDMNEADAWAEFDALFAAHSDAVSRL